MNVVILSNPGDWCEIFAGGESIYRGHISDVELDVILAQLGHVVTIHEDVPLAIDNRTFITDGLDVAT